MTRASVARRVRERKELRPELYCRFCLWRLSSGPCPKHPAREAQAIAQVIERAEDLDNK